MTAAEKIFALWSADATATALVPAARFKYAGPYQNITAPYVIYSPITVQRYRTISEGATNALEYGIWQFSIFSASASGADDIRRKLITVLDGNKGGFNFFFISSLVVDVDQERQLVHVAADFRVTEG